MKRKSQLYSSDQMTQAQPFSVNLAEATQNKEIMKVLSIIITSTLLLLVAACSSQDMADKFTPKGESQFAEEYLRKLQLKDYEHIKKYISPSIEAQVTDEKLVEVADYFPTGELLSTELIGSQIQISSSQWRGNFSFEYQFSNGWAIANTALEKSDNTLSVIGFNVYRTEQSQKELNAFTLTGKSALQYLALMLAVLVPLFILVSTYFCIRTPIPKRKWLWVIFVLIGMGTFSVNWTTGQNGFQTLSILLFSASALKASAFAPWVISVSFPVGAVMFWFKRKGLIEEKNRLDAKPDDDIDVTAEKIL